MANKYDERYDIRLARYDEIDEIMTFIDDEWKKGHIMARNRELFEYEFVYEDQVCFMIAKDRETDSIAGVQGFMPASALNNKPDIWGSIWKVKKDTMPMLGVEIERRLVSCEKIRYDVGVGVNKNTTLPLLKSLFRYNGFRMMHFYRLSEKNDFKIAGILNPKYKRNESETKTVVKRFANAKELNECFDAELYMDTVPHKDNWYISHRFLEHPIYDYDVYGLFSNDRCDAIMVIRKQEYEDSAIYRIVDYIGNLELFGGLYSFFDKLLSEVEYIDFYCYGMDKDIIEKAGFFEREENDENILPNYFAPFVKENIDIWAVSPVENTLCFKADADQDRPN